MSENTAGMGGMRQIWNKLHKIADGQQVIEEVVATLEARLETLLGGGDTSGIDNLREVLAFLDGMTDDATLAARLADIGKRLQEHTDVLADKADRTELSNVLAVEPLTPGNFPEIETLTREEIKEDLFIDLWNEACVHYPVEMHSQSLGGFDKETGLYLLSDVELTWPEARTTLMAGRPQGLNVNSYLKNNKDIRVNLPSREMNHVVDYPFYYCSRLEVANAHNMTFKRPVYGCPALHTINGLVDVGFSSSLLFCDQPTLRSLTITRLSKSLNLGNQPLLTADSFRRIIAGAVDEPTISVHPAVYALLTGEDDGWRAVLEAAAAKNIVFTTTD